MMESVENSVAELAGLLWSEFRHSGFLFGLEVVFLAYIVEIELASISIDLTYAGIC